MLSVHSFLSLTRTCESIQMIIWIDMQWLSISCRLVDYLTSNYFQPPKKTTYYLKESVQWLVKHQSITGNSWYQILNVENRVLCWTIIWRAALGYPRYLPIWWHSSLLLDTNYLPRLLHLLLQSEMLPLLLAAWKSIGKLGLKYISWSPYQSQI